MTGKQIHSIVHRLEAAADLGESAMLYRMLGNREKTKRYTTAKARLVTRVYRDLGRWMSHPQEAEFAAAESVALKHRMHANGKRQPRAA